MDVAQHLGEPRKLLFAVFCVCICIVYLMVIVFSALTITTSGIRAQELRSWGRRRLKKPTEEAALKFVFCISDWQKICTGTPALDSRLTDVPALQTQHTGALSQENSLVFCEGAPEGSRALILFLVERTPFILQEARKWFRSASPFLMKVSYEFLFFF